MANLDNRSKQAMTLPAFARMASKLPPGKLATTVSSKPEAASAASSSGGRRRRSSMVVFDESQSPTQQVAAAAAVMSTLASNNMAQAFTPGGHRIEGNLPISQSPLHHLSSSLESSALAGIASDLPATAAIPSSVQGQRGLGSSAILRSVKLAGRRAPHAADPLESGSTPSSSAEPDGALERLRLAAKRTWEAPETANAKNPLETENQRGHAATSSSSPSGSPTVASTNKRVR
ncbi:hypothetical protein CAOG_001138 [Capsaspora owczarzaki ATCC 30864]|uniref:Uncharacterized protein n=2 Tax=Capsaspora owczarzaki (strain ATCC 30864) TaxID=595528 RepID=A0A0D2VIC2_CAPO3|nr:hypothetical protein CAOG_001138 [Capsaspora owczarzaki ATCC 30864]